MLLLYKKDSKLIFLDLTGQLHHLQKIYYPHLNLYHYYFCSAPIGLTTIYIKH